MSEIDFSLSPMVANIVRILGVSSESTANIVKSEIRYFRELSKFLSREENNHIGWKTLSFKFKSGLDKVQGAAPKEDPEGGPMTVESLFALYKEQRLRDRESKKNRSG